MWKRYIAIGDSSTEGIDDPAGGLRGWADRLAIRFAADQGATVLTFTLPDPTPNMPFGRAVGLRLAAFNETLRAGAARTGTILVDVAAIDFASDPRLWSDDRLHGNTDGHVLLAKALAHGLGLPSADESWREPLPPVPAMRRGVAAGVLSDIIWARRHALPWFWRTLRGTSVGDGRSPKHSTPIPL